MDKIAVLGAGSWGTALSIGLAAKGFSVSLWARDEVLTENINREQENVRYLNGCHIPDLVTATADLAEAMQKKPK